MSDLTCPACEAKSGDGLLCAKCIGETRRWLRSVRDLWPAMTAPKTRRSSLDGGSASSDRTPLPVDLDASDDSEDVRTRLVGIVRELELGDMGEWETGCWCAPYRACDGRRWIPLPDWPPAWCRWIDDRMQRLVIHAAALDLRGEIRTCQRLVLRHAGRGGRDDLFCGYCHTCGAGLYAQPGKTEIVCKACKQAGIEDLIVYNVATSREGLRSLAEDSLVTKTEAAGVAQVKRQTLDTWIARGRVLARGGRVRLGDVLDAAEGMRKRAAS